MLKSILTATAVSFLVAFAFGQRMLEDVTVQFKDLNLEKSRDVELVSAFKTDEGYIVLKKEPIRGPGGWNYFIENFDEDLVSNGVHDITQQFEDENYVIERIIKVKDSYVLFSTKNFPDARRVDLFAQKFILDDNKLTKPLRIYSEDYERRRSIVNFNINASFDETMLLITIHPPYARGEKERIVFKVIDENLEEVFEKEDVQLEEEDQVYSIKQTSISNTGEIYIIGSKYVPRDRKLGRERSKTEYELVVVSDGDREITPIELKNELFIDNVALTYGEKGELYLGGYYRKEDGTGIDGVFLFTLNEKTAEIEDELYDEFTKEFITEGWSDRALKKAERKESKGVDLGLSNLEFRQVIQHDDGSRSMIGEVFWITYHTRTDANGNTTTYTVYHYGDLVVTRISPEGEVISHGRYNKHYTYYGAYLCFDLNNQVAVVRNTSRLKILDENVEEMSKIDKKKKGGDALIISLISEDGTVEDYGLLDYFRGSDIYRYRRYKRIADEAYVMKHKGKTEIVALTYYGSKKFGLARFQLD